MLPVCIENWEWSQLSQTIQSLICSLNYLFICSKIRMKWNIMLGMKKLCFGVCDFKDERKTASQDLQYLKWMWRIPFVGYFETNRIAFLRTMACCLITNNNISNRAPNHDGMRRKQVIVNPLMVQASTLNRKPVLYDNLSCPFSPQIPAGWLPHWRLHQWLPGCLLPSLRGLGPGGQDRALHPLHGELWRLQCLRPHFQRVQAMGM